MKFVIEPIPMINASGKVIPVRFKLPDGPMMEIMLVMSEYIIARLWKLFLHAKKRITPFQVDAVNKCQSLALNFAAAGPEFALLVKKYTNHIMYNQPEVYSQNAVSLMYLWAPAWSFAPYQQLKDYFGNFARIECFERGLLTTVEILMHNKNIMFIVSADVCRVQSYFADGTNSVAAAMVPCQEQDNSAELIIAGLDPKIRAHLREMVARHLKATIDATRVRAIIDYYFN